jgi:protease I
MAKVLFIIAQSGFRDEELFDTQAALEAAGHTTAVASTRAGRCTGMRGGSTTATLVLDDLDPGAWDAVVFVGGGGARALFDDVRAHAVATGAIAADRVVAAICIAPTILARAGLLRGRRATAYGSEVESLAAAGAHVADEDVVSDGRLITASGPAHARAFGSAISAALRDARPAVAART